MPKVPLNTITSGYGTVDALNANFDAIEAAFDNTLSRDGDTPNQMSANLDMNGFNILNQGNPITVEGFNWEGQWLTATAYQVGDVVQQTGSAYICVVAHTSGVFATDLAAFRWQLVAQANLPTQTGNSGKYLTTNGTSASWDDVKYTPLGAGAVQRTVTSKAQESVSIKDFGVIGDGIADDTAALQAAINALPNGGTLIFGANRCKITSTLQIGDGSVSAISTKQNLRIVGDGVYGSSNQEISPGFPARSLLIWAGAAGGTMISINGPMVNSIEGVQLDGADIADVGILDTHSIGGVLDVHVRRVRLSYVQFRAHENTPLCFTSSGAGRVARIRGYDPTAGVANFSGVDVGNPIYNGNTPGLDVARLELALLEISRPDGASNDCLTFRMCDNIRIGKVFLYGSSATVGNAFAVRVPTGASPLRTYYPTCIGFDDFAYRGGFYFDPTWAPWSAAARGRGIFIKSLQEGDSAELIPTHPAVTGYTYAGLPFGALDALSRVASQVQVTGTTAATTVWSYAIPGYSMQANRRVRLTASGTYINNTGAPRNLFVYCDYGLQTLFNASVSVPASALVGAWSFTADMGPYGGTVGAQESFSQFTAYAAGTVGGVGGGVLSGTPLGAHNNTLTVDSSVAQTMRLIFTNANAGQVLNLHSLVLELV